MVQAQDAQRIQHGVPLSRASVPLAQALSSFSRPPVRPSGPSVSVLCCVRRPSAEERRGAAAAHAWGGDATVHEGTNTGRTQGRGTERTHPKNTHFLLASPVCRSCAASGSVTVGPCPTPLLPVPVSGTGEGWGSVQGRHGHFSQRAQERSTRQCALRTPCGVRGSGIRRRAGEPVTPSLGRSGACASTVGAHRGTEDGTPPTCTLFPLHHQRWPVRQGAVHERRALTVRGAQLSSACLKFEGGGVGHVPLSAHCSRMCVCVPVALAQESPQTAPSVRVR
jgi:hypothetical protein